MTVLLTLQGRLFHHLRDSPNFAKLWELLADPVQDTVNVCNYILNHSSIDTAEGDLLDKIGALIGVDRPAEQEDPENIFTLCRLGEANDPDNSTGFYDDTDPTAPTGGYFTTRKGLNRITESDQESHDAYYRFLIRQKAWSYRRKMTHLNLWNYLIAFGSNCLIEEYDTLNVRIDPLNYYDLDEWQKDYVINKGFKPAGTYVHFRDNMRHGSST